MSNDVSRALAILDEMVREWDLHGTSPDPDLFEHVRKELKGVVPLRSDGETPVGGSIRFWRSAVELRNRTTHGAAKGADGGRDLEGATKLHKRERHSGARLRLLAQRLFSPRTYSHVLEPTLSDLAEEHALALAEERPWRARRVRFRGYCSFWAAVAAYLGAALGRRVAKLWARS